MLPPRRIAVISDLHIGMKARALDLCPHPIPDEQKIGMTADFVSRFALHVQSPEFKRGGPIDDLFVTGDISNQADPIEFRRAHDVVCAAAQALGVPAERIFFVPGNHDVHWPVMKLSPIEFWRRFRYEPLLESGLLFRKRVEGAAMGSYHTEPHYLIWDTPQVLLLGLNTAAFDAAEPEHGKHNGLITQESLASLDAALHSMRLNQAQLRVCLLHHHPLQYSDPYPNYPDYSALTNAGNLFELFTRHRIDLVVHGHKHVPHLEHRHATTNGHPVTVLGAGSFSAKLETQWVGPTQNQFHVVNVHGRHPTTSAAVGFVETWNYDVDGFWRPSHSKTGLGATEAFGSLTTVAEIIAAVSPLVDSLLASQGNCPWSDVVRRLPELVHVNTKRAFEAFDEIKRTKNLRRYGDLDSAERDWILLR